MSERPELTATNPNHYHGKPCLYGHTLRYRKGNSCIECRKACKARGGGLDIERKRFYGRAGSPLKDRNQAIVADFDSPEQPTKTELARKYGISRMRIAQIIAKARYRERRANPEPCNA